MDWANIDLGFVGALLESAHPLSIDLGGLHNTNGFPSASQHASTLISLRQSIYSGMTVPDFGAWTKLESVTLISADDTATLSFASFNATASLKHLNVSAGIFSYTDLEALATYPALTELYLGEAGDAGCIFISAVAPLPIPITLRTLSIVNISGSPCQFALSNNNALTSLTISKYAGEGNFEIAPNGLPPSLTTLMLGDDLNWFEYLPSLTYLTNLKTVSFGSGTSILRSDFIPDALCNRMNYDLLENVTIKSIDLDYGTQFPPIPCLQSMTSLSAVTFESPTRQHIDQLVAASLAQITPAILSRDILSGSSPTATPVPNIGGRGIVDLRILNFNWTYNPADDAELALPWSDFVAALPNLNTLVMIEGAWSCEFPGEELKTLKQLKYLYLEPIIRFLVKREEFGAKSSLLDFESKGRMSGTIPSDFFLRLPNLKTIILPYQQLNGSIPWYGLERLEEMDLTRNEFERWPSLNLTYSSVPGYGPPSNLRKLSLNGNEKLLTLPDDASWARMAPGLRDLDLSFLSISLPLPPSLFSSTSGLQYLNAYDSVWSSSLPTSIGAPNLTFIDIESTEVCGGLPRIANSGSFNFSDSSLLTIQAGFSKIQGTIPASYGTYWTFLDLQYNTELNGTLPSSFAFFGAESAGSTIYMRDTSIQGPMFDTTLMGPNDGFSLSNTAVDACSTTLTHPIECFPPPTACNVACASGSSWTTYCNGHSQYCSGNPTVPIPSTVVSPCAPLVVVLVAAPPIPPELTPSSNCPPPRPSPSFQCIAGQWTSLQGVNGDAIVVPPNGVTYIAGDLTTNNLRFLGTSGSLQVAGCVFLGTNDVNIEIIDSDIDRISNAGGRLKQTIIQAKTTNCTGSSDLGLVGVSTTKKHGGCHRASSERSASSTNGQLVVVFGVDRNLCNLAIALPIVFFVLLGLVVVVSIVIWRRQKNKFNKHVSSASA